MQSASSRRSSRVERTVRIGRGRSGRTQLATFDERSRSSYERGHHGCQRPADPDSGFDRVRRLASSGMIELSPSAA